MLLRQSYALMAKQSAIMVVISKITNPIATVSAGKKPERRFVLVWILRPFVSFRLSRVGKSTVPPAQQVNHVSMVPVKSQVVCTMESKWPKVKRCVVVRCSFLAKVPRS
jgi:hypothetical protein